MNRIGEAELVFIRNKRIKELKMWSIIQEMSTYWCFLAVLYPITYSNLNPDGFNQVNHLQKFILNSRQIDLGYTKVCLFFFISNKLNIKRIDFDNR